MTKFIVLESNIYNISMIEEISIIIKHEDREKDKEYKGNKIKFKLINGYHYEFVGRGITFLDVCIKHFFGPTDREIILDVESSLKEGIRIYDQAGI